MNPNTFGDSKRISLPTLKRLQGAKKTKSNDMKTTILGITAIILATLAQIYFAGINGLTLVSVPLTIFLGLNVLEKVTENESNC